MRDWSTVAAAAAGEAGARARAAAAGGRPAAELLGDFLPRLAQACTAGDRLDSRALAGFRVLGARAADEAVALPALIDLYLSAAWRAWRCLPVVTGTDPESIRLAGESVLRAVDDVVAAVAEGYQAARRAALRLEESSRREFVDDLLGGTGDPAGMLGRAERFGPDLTGPHAVAVVRGPRPHSEASPRLSQATAALATAGAGDFLVTTRHDQMVAVLPALGLVDTLFRSAGEQIGVGRVHRGVSGVAQSYHEALDALELATRLGLADAVVYAEHLLVYRVLLRDREAIDELIQAVLAPLRAARGGAGPLLDTIEAYLATGANTTATARRLHLSVRAVTYRLQRIRDLSGHDPTTAHDRFVLQAALIGARSLGWPQADLAASRDIAQPAPRTAA